MTEREYGKLVQEMSHKSPMWKDCLNAFWIGGLICTLGQLAITGYKALGLDQQNAAMAASMSLVALSALLMQAVRDTAQTRKIGPAVLDALGMVGGAAAVCIPVGLIRELLGTGIEHGHGCAEESAFRRIIHIFSLLLLCW